ncbi:MAG: hypothetical protein GKR92_05350 [Gammaproteobacteria bacterium]|nr:MAG: hypothetical protein GKR92_05350 [Gammaproteobacteria bacterium]
MCATTLHGEDAQDEIDPEQLTPIMPDEVLPANKPDNNHMKMMMEVCKDQIVSMMLNGIEIPDTGILQDVDHFIFMWDRTIKTSNDEQDATKISAHCYVGKEKGDITKLLIDGIQVI